MADRPLWQTIPATGLGVVADIVGHAAGVGRLGQFVPGSEQRDAYLADRDANQQLARQRDRALQLANTQYQDYLANQPNVAAQREADQRQRETLAAYKLITTPPPTGGDVTVNIDDPAQLSALALRLNNPDDFTPDQRLGIQRAIDSMPSPVTSEDVPAQGFPGREIAIPYYPRTAADAEDARVRAAQEAAASRAQDRTAAYLATQKAKLERLNEAKATPLGALVTQPPKSVINLLNKTYGDDPTTRNAAARFARKAYDAGYQQPDEALNLVARNLKEATRLLYDWQKAAGDSGRVLNIYDAATYMTDGALTQTAQAVLPGAYQLRLRGEEPPAPVSSRQQARKAPWPGVVRRLPKVADQAAGVVGRKMLRFFGGTTNEPEDTIAGFPPGAVQGTDYFLFGDPSTRGRTTEPKKPKATRRRP